MRNWSAPLLVTATLLLGACRDAGDTASPSAPVFASSAQERPVYIVTFKSGVNDVAGTARALSSQHGSSPVFTYTAAIRGFAAPFSPQAAAALANNPNVASVEQDQQVFAVGTQSGATWGIDRIDQRDLPLDGSYDYANDGAGVTAYIIDTGILTSHNEFGGRAVAGFDAVTSGGSAVDCNGHGTHVSGTVGGATYGVAKGVSLVAVRVLNCQGSGTTSGVIAGIDWVINHRSSGPAVANMSLGGGASSTLDDAVTRAVNAGIVFAVAGGNDNANACNSSPARAAAAITVGATTSGDARASYSNYGTCLDIFAPGSSITSSWIGSTSATNTISGTSMATPHVTGAAALYLSAHTGASVSEVTTALTSNASANRVTSAGTGSPNRLLYTGSLADNGGGSGGGGVVTITLAVGTSRKGANTQANLTWTGATTNLSIYKGASLIASGSGSSYSDNLGKGSGSATYKVCVGSNCSNSVTVNW